MTNKNAIENKISSIKRYLRQLRRYQKSPQSEILNNTILLGFIERYLYLSCQATIDLAEAVISLKKLPKPPSLKENFQILYEYELIPQKLKINLVKMTGFRNILANDYEKNRL